jgi:hypothetical protein
MEMIEKDCSFFSVKPSKVLFKVEDYSFQTNDYITGFDALNIFFQ